MMPQVSWTANARFCRGGPTRQHAPVCVSTRCPEQTAYADAFREYLVTGSRRAPEFKDGVADYSPLEASSGGKLPRALGSACQCSSGLASPLEKRFTIRQPN